MSHWIAWLLGGVVVVMTTASLAAATRQRRQASGVFNPAMTTLQWLDPTPSIGAIGGTAYSRAVVLDQRGGTFSPQPTITYSSGTPANVTIDSGTGLCTAVANGTSTITAQVTGTVGGVLNPSISQTATVAQQPASISGVSSTLSTDDASSGTFSPSALDANAHAISGATFAYSSANPSVITVNATSGAWAGQSAGSASITIQATANGVTVSLVVTVSVAHAGTAPGAPTASNATSQTSSSLTFPVTLNASGSLPTALAWRYSTDNATWTNGADITLTSPSLGQEIDESLSPGFSAGTQYYVQFAAKNGAGTSAWSASATGTTTASGAAPVFTSITPNSLAQNTSATCSIVGDNLTADTVMTLLPSGVSWSNFVLTDAQHATVLLAAASNAAVTSGNVGLQNSNGSSSALAFSVTAGTPSGTAVSALHLISTASTTHPSASKSVAIPAAFAPTKISGSMSTWKKFDTTPGSSVIDALVQATHSTPQALAFAGWVSPALSAQIVPAMTLTFAYGLFSEAGDASAWYADPVIYILRPSTDAVVGFLHDSAAGIGSVAHGSNTNSGKVATITTAADISIDDGDVLVLEWWDVGGTSTFLHHEYNGNVGAFTEGSNYNTTGDATIGFSTPVYLAPSPLGFVRVGPSGVSSSTSNANIVAATITTDADFRALIPAANTSPIPLWDTSQTAKLGTGGSHVDGKNFLAAAKACDLVNLDTTVTYTDRDSVTRNTLHTIVRPAGGAPLDPSKDSLNSPSLTSELDFWLPNGRAWKNYYIRRVFRFGPGYRLDAPNNTASNTSGYNLDQSGAYKLGPHPENAGTRADLEVSGGQNFGSEYLTANIGTIGVTRDDGVKDSNYYVGAGMAAIMPGWNTGGDFWEIIRVLKVQPDNSVREKIWIGKLTDATVTLVSNRTFTLDTASAWQAFTAFNVLGKNFNRQLASTDTPPEVWFGDTEFADPTESVFVWPTQIPSGDHF